VDWRHNRGIVNKIVDSKTKSSISRREAIGLLTTLAASACSRTISDTPPIADQKTEPIHYLGLREVAQRIQAQEISPVDLTNKILQRIGAIDPKLNSYVTVMRQQAMDSAERASEEIRNGKYRGPLHGVPVAVKDLCFTKGVRTMAGTKVYENFVPDHDATVVTKLNDAGAVLLGKLTLSEAAMAGYNPDFKIPSNPWREDVWTGTSSSGSGVATAAGLCYGAIGTDTGGSIGFPAAANGVVGLKPTYGRVSRYGVFSLAESMDHVGAMARRVGDVAVMLETIAGSDPNDPTSLADPKPKLLADIDKEVRGLRIGFDLGFAQMGATPEHVAAVRVAVQALRQLGTQVIDVQVPDTADVQKAWFTIATKEAAAAHKANFPAHADEYGPYFREFLKTGTAVSDVDYDSAVRFRKDYASRYSAVVGSIDALVCPVFGSFPITKKAQYGSMADWQAAMDQYMSQFDPAPAWTIFTMPVNFAGLPSLTLPCGFTKDGLPMGMELVGPRLSEATLCRIGNAYEKATDWHRRHPPV
jgi:amidase